MELTRNIQIKERQLIERKNVFMFGEDVLFRRVRNETLRRRTEDEIVLGLRKV